MTLEKERTTIGVFAKCSDAQLVLQELKASNFPMHKVSVIAGNAEKGSDIASAEVKKRTGNILSSDAAEAVSGALGSITGFLVDLVLWVIPGKDRVLPVEEETAAIATTLPDGLPSIFLTLGIRREQAHYYSDFVSKGYYLVIVTGIDDMETRLAKRTFNGRDIQQSSIYQPYSTPNSRYKNAVGVFSVRQDAERAITELRNAGFPMNQVLVIGKDTTLLNDLTEVDINVSKYNYSNLEIPEDLARYYEHKVTLGNYLLVLNSTDIYMAGARAILESNNIQDFRIYSKPALNLTKSDRHRQAISNF